MRWFWIDRFLEFEHGRRAVAVKNVSLAEDHIDEYYSGYPVLTPSLVIEGFAQAGGLLVAEYNSFHERVVLAKVSSAKFHFFPRPGDLLTYSLTLDSIQPDGARVSGESRAGDRFQGEVELFFAHLDDRGPDSLFDPAAFLRMLRIFRLYDVGVDQHGKPLKIPTHLLEAERSLLTQPSNDDPHGLAQSSLK